MKKYLRYLGPVLLSLLCCNLLFLNFSHANCSTLLSDRLPPEILQSILEQTLNDTNVQFDQYGLVIPQYPHSDPKTAKIANNYNQIKKYIHRALSERKDVLYLIGSFDLIHKGHVAMIVNAIRNYLIEQELQREDVYVVVLADHKNLTFNFKKAKWQEYGGTESVPRPIQSKHNFPTPIQVSPRLLDLAQLPVDLVGFTPDPETAINSLFKQKQFKKTLKELLPLLDSKSSLLAKYPQPEGVHNSEAHFKNITNYTKFMISDILAENGQKILSGFLNYDTKEENLYWDLSSWQFILHAFLNIKPSHKVVKFLNERDSDYLDRVAAYTLAAGMGVKTISGTDGFQSTTKLIEEFGAEKLLSLKMKYYHQIYED